MRRKKKLITVYLTQEQDGDLRRLHNLTKVPVAVYVREGVDRILLQHKDLLAEESVAID